MKQPQDELNLIPRQRTGKSIEAESILDFPSEKKAEEFFETVKHRLQDVNHWDKVAGGITAHFQLVNKDGCEVKRPVQKGDYLKIDVPGPGSEVGSGYDWVQVEDVKSNASDVDESFGFRVRPTVNPFSTKKEIAHFYSSESTSSFTVARKGNKVVAAIYDRNAKPNKNAKMLTDKIRDTVAGAVGIFSFSRIQWKNLTDGLLTR